MKSRKTLITLGIIVAVLALGVGYAAIGNINLNITGNVSATPDTDNFKVVFDSSSEVAVTKTNEDSTVATSVSDLTATLNVSGLTTVGDTVTAKFTIKNNSTGLSATVTQSDITVSNTDYFEVATDWEESTIKAGEIKTVTVTVKLTKTPIEDQSATITIPFVASPVVE